VHPRDDSAFRFRTREWKVKTVNFDIDKNRPKLIGYHSNVLGLLRKLCQFNNLHARLYHSWNVGEDWFSSCWDIWWDRPIFSKLVHPLWRYVGYQHLQFLKSQNFMANGVQTVETHQRAKYHQNLSLSCEDN